MVLDSSDMADSGRDPRLDQALQLLRRPTVKAASAGGAVAACVALVAATGLLAVTMMFQKSDAPPAAKPALTQAQTSASAPGFELSGSSLSADAPVRDAVVAGSEGSR